MTIWEK